MISPIVLAAATLFFLSTQTLAQPTPLIGVTEEGKNCTAPLECRSPLYCVPKNSSILKSQYTCEKMPCSPLAPCSIGLQCGADSFCEGLPCSSDSECLGITICSQTESRCKPKVSSGNSCARNAECWSDKCDDNICLSANIEETRAPYTRNRAADISLGVLGLLSLITLLLLCILCMKRDKIIRNNSSSNRDFEDTDIDTEDPIVPNAGRRNRYPSLGDRLKGIPGTVKKGAAGAVEGAKHGAGAVGDAVQNGTTAAVDTARNGASAAGNGLRNGTAAAGDGLRHGATAAGDGIRHGATAAGDGIRHGATAAVDTGKRVAGAAVDTGKRAAETVEDAVPDSVKNAAAKAGDTVKEGATRVAEGAADAADAAKNAAAGAVDKAKNIFSRE